MSAFARSCKRLAFVVFGDNPPEVLHTRPALFTEIQFLYNIHLVGVKYVDGFTNWCGRFCRSWSVATAVVSDTVFAETALVAVFTALFAVIGNKHPTHGRRIPPCALAGQQQLREPSFCVRQSAFVGVSFRIGLPSGSLTTPKDSHYLQNHLWQRGDTSKFSTVRYCPFYWHEKQRGLAQHLRQNFVFAR